MLVFHRSRETTNELLSILSQRPRFQEHHIGIASRSAAERSKAFTDPFRMSDVSGLEKHDIRLPFRCGRSRKLLFTKPSALSGTPKSQELCPFQPATMVGQILD